MTNSNIPGFQTIDIGEIETMCQSYIDQRDALISALRTDPPRHMEFINFVNAQSTLLNRQLGGLGEGELRMVLKLTYHGQFMFSEMRLYDAFLELLLTQIALLEAKRLRTAVQN